MYYVSIDRFSPPSQLHKVIYATDVSLYTYEKQHIRLYDIFFQGDTIENVSNELKDIMENGNYLIGTRREQFALSYQPCVLLKESSSHSVGSRNNTEIQLCREEIDNFVQKLGFLDPKDDEDLVKKFRHITNVSLH